MGIADILKSLIPYSGLIGGGLQAVSTIGAGLLNVNAQKQANEANLAYAQQLRADELAQQQYQNQQNELTRSMQYSLERKKLQMEKEQNAYEKQKYAEETGYNRLQHAADQFATYLNNKNTLLSNRMSPLMKG